ncbi:cytochrome c oxidase subunit 3 [Gluconacetobacter sacchari]|uniref:Cytochrome C oxidase subunit III n=2 Tax=Gluconacetobacter sacchari TaxID=92759 RepID=A0A7W4IDY4_9PROT|nr:cytochrome c oxidase subunit 3 [Gluconacetobacter sacchari]MBB2161017.1 cytochrome C oxidase subunit III [Gluconacetobacter sacchari]GBQ24603.1 cytochrome c oxidase subunit III [Gluconacetobacter sacchari DSM 12717]
MSDGAVLDRHAPYETTLHRDETAIAGMWLFLASETLLFGGLFLVCLVYSQTRADGWAEGVRHTNLAIGAVNTLVLITSSAIYTMAVEAGRRGDNRRVMRFGLGAAVLGLAFLVLKGVEWGQEFSENLFPGPHFALHGPNARAAELFYSFYFLATFLHGMHMVVGIGLILWIGRKAHQGAFSAAWSTPVDVVGLYWSFVDLVWMLLFPLLYLIGRA